MDKIALLERKVDFLEQENKQLRWKLHLVELENSRLKQRLSQYEKPGKDSHNSHIPPSQESIASHAVRRNQSLREKSDKPTGGQPGHKGFTFQLPEQVDKEEIHTVDYCPCCGKDLRGVAEELIEEKWSIDIPPVVPVVTLHKVMGKPCSCGCLAKGETPPFVKGYFSYGPHIRAMVAYLNIEHHLPYQRLSRLTNELFSIRMSQGTIYNLLQSIKNASMGMYEEIQHRIGASPVVGADETSQNINGQKHWAWVFQTDRLTYIYSHPTRGKQAIEQHFSRGLPHSCLVSDRYVPYFSMNVKKHQICLAHLLRELTYLCELDPKHQWSKQMKKLLQEAIHKRKTLPWEKIDRKQILEKFNKLLYQTLDHLHKDIQNLQKGLIKHRDNVFNFLFDPQIPYDNNASERAIRPVKLKQKVSGCFRSQQGAMAYAVIHSIADTAKKNKQSQWLALREMAYL
jgi:transposase